MSISITICEKRKAVLKEQRHILVEGGPGCGKTTLALLKANEIINSGTLKRNQKVLFLSFARATITRVEDQAKALLTALDRNRIEINTYHGFAWRLIQSHAQLLCGHPYFKLIAPPQLAAILAIVPDSMQASKMNELFQVEGKICFDLFASTVAELLLKSKRVREIYSIAYPNIIVDEFQDTDSNEWDMIRLLGEKSQIIALADLNQRIFEFRGASVKRIPIFKNSFNPFAIDFGTENNRSSNTDIVQFGDDLLTGSNKLKTYKNVLVNRYSFLKEQRDHLKFTLFNSINRLKKANVPSWSIAVLVKRKIETLTISSYLQQNGIGHDVIIDQEGPSLSAGLIAFLLEPERLNQKRLLIERLITHIRGRRGDKVSQKALELANVLDDFINKKKLIKGSKRTQLINGIDLILARVRAIKFSGVPEEDWLKVRKLFQESSHEALTGVYEDALFIKLLRRGNLLSERLADSWRQHRAYVNASSFVEEALTQDHFAMTSISFSGVYVMNIHKCKGKEFDEVIIWEAYGQPFIWEGTPKERLVGERILLRVAATRARSMVTFLTPASKPCVLL